MADEALISVAIPIVLLLVAVALLLLALRWLLITTEGVFLGSRVVVWLYDLSARRYDGIKQFDPDTESAFIGWPLRRRLKPWPAPLILDVATGTGRLAASLLAEPDFHGRLIGLDASRRMLAVAAEKLAPYGDRAMFVHQTAQALPFARDSFAAVTCLEALEFLPDDQIALREMVRVLEPGGYLLVTRRTGPEAAAFLRRHRERDEFAAMLRALGQQEILIQPWQVEYDLVWSRKPDN